MSREGQEPTIQLADFPPVVQNRCRASPDSLAFCPWRERSFLEVGSGGVIGDFNLLRDSQSIVLLPTLSVSRTHCLTAFPEALHVNHGAPGPSSLLPWALALWSQPFATYSYAFVAVIYSPFLCSCGFVFLIPILNFLNCEMCPITVEECIQHIGIVYRLINAFESISWVKKQHYKHIGSSVYCLLLSFFMSLLVFKKAK